MVKKLILILFICLNEYMAYPQQPANDIENLIQFKAKFTEDTIRVDSFAKLNLSFINKTNDSVSIYPKGLIFLDIVYGRFEMMGDLYLITDRLTQKFESTIAPRDTLKLTQEVYIEKKYFIQFVEELTVDHVSYPYWLNLQERKCVIYGKLESEPIDVVLEYEKFYPDSTTYFYMNIN